MQSYRDQLTKSFIVTKGLWCSDYFSFSGLESFYGLASSLCFDDSSCPISPFLDDSSFSFWWFTFALNVPPCLFNPHHPSSISTSTNTYHTHTQTTTTKNKWSTSLGHQHFILVGYPILSDFKSLTVSNAVTDFWTCCACEYVNSVYQGFCDSCSHSRCGSCEDIDIP